MRAEDPLLDAYRLIRRVDASTESPWSGMLAHSESGGTVLLVDVEELGAEWPGWLVRADGHLLAPIDLVRRSNGHDAVISPCAERLADFLGRRAEAVLDDGERLTIAVSLLRGLVEAVDLPDALETRGEWWLSEGGRPVFALCTSPRSITDETEKLLQDVEIGAGDRLEPALAEVIETIRDPSRLIRNAARLEQALFAAVTPEPLATTIFAPRRARAAVAWDNTADDVVGERETLVGRLARHVDADLADAFSQATTAVWRRFRADKAPRKRRPIIVAGAAAAAVVAGGLLWPAGGPATAQPEPPTSSPSTTAAEPVAVDPEVTGGGVAEGESVSTGADTGVQDAESAASGDTGAPESLVSALDALLGGRTSCGGEAGCLAAFLEDPLDSLPAGAIDLPPAQRTIEFVDDFGGAAVLEVAASDAEGAVQLVVIVRRDEKWLIRDVMDVPDQPR